MARIVILEGRSAQTVYELDGGRFSVGREVCNDAQIEDGTVSRTHAAITFEHGRWRLTDLHSHNGTLVNGARVETAALSSGDVIKIGEVRLLFQDARSSGITDLDVETGTLTEFTSLDGVTTDPKLTPVRSGAGISNARLRAVLELANRSQQAGADHELLSEAVRTFEQAIGGCRASLVYTAPRSKTVIFRPRKGASAGSASFCSPVKQRVAERAIATGNSGIWCSDNGSPLYETNDGRKIGSMIFSPIGNPRRTLGALIAERRIDDQPFRRDDLEFSIAFASLLCVVLEACEVRTELSRTRQLLDEEVESKYSIVGNSRAIRTVFEFIERTASADATVLIQGESGTGKELVARAIHRQGDRTGKRFEVINCGVLEKELAESELFGHRKGSFTSAFTDRRGRFELANGGVLFLDEIGELSPACQAKLLRAVQFGEIRPLGAEKDVKVDVRIVAATNRDLLREVAEGRFREDLYFRLSALSIHVPPLRERREDIGLLIDHFLVRICRRTGIEIRTITGELEQFLMNHSWPGNVRQLENALESMVVMAKDDVLTLADVPPELRKANGDGANGVGVSFEAQSLNEVIRRHVLSTLAHVGGNKTKAAEILGIDRGTLHNKLRSYND